MKAIVLSLGLLLGVLAAVPTEAQAGFPLLSRGDIRRIIGPYPALGTEAAAADFESLLEWQNTRTPEQCALADADHEDSYANLFAGPNGPLTPREARNLRGYMSRFAWAVDINIGHAKSIYRRPRPFVTRPDINPCISRPRSSAYPSGHTISARVYARILSKVYPDRAEAFMKRADEAALNRVIGGVHHPSDIEAGKKLGDAIAERMVGE